jgi:hypothetical protein
MGGCWGTYAVPRGDAWERGSGLLDLEPSRARGGLPGARGGGGGTVPRRAVRDGTPRGDVTTRRGGRQGSSTVPMQGMFGM